MNDITPKNKELVVFVRLTDLHSSPWQSRFEPFTTEKGQPGQPQEIDELAASIEKNGMMQPILVRPLENGYEIIDGHRRVQAMRKLGRGQILAIIRDVTDHEAQVMHVIGNLLSTLQLDSRILEDLARNNLIKDLRVLRLIRLIEPVDNNGVSNMQWELYRKALFTKMGRKELAVLIKKSLNKMPVRNWKMKFGSNKITINIATGILDQAKKDKLMKLITDKMNEIGDAL